MIVIGKKPTETGDSQSFKWLYTAVHGGTGASVATVARVRSYEHAKKFESTDEAETFINEFNLDKDYCIYTISTGEHYYENKPGWWDEKD